jgi:hypothetical protein
MPGGGNDLDEHCSLMARAAGISTSTGIQLLGEATPYSTTSLSPAEQRTSGTSVHAFPDLQIDSGWHAFWGIPNLETTYGVPAYEEQLVELPYYSWEMQHQELAQTSTITPSIWQDSDSWGSYISGLEGCNMDAQQSMATENFNLPAERLLATAGASQQVLSKSHGSRTVVMRKLCSELALDRDGTSELSFVTFCRKWLI